MLTLVCVGSRAFNTAAPVPDFGAVVELTGHDFTAKILLRRVESDRLLFWQINHQVT